MKFSAQSTSPFAPATAQAPSPVVNQSKKTYTVSGPKGEPILGMLRAGKRDPLHMVMQNSYEYGDIIPFHVLGRKIVQLNHPDLVRYVLMENHKNYIKSKSYLRVEVAIGKGLFTSDGEKWKRDRQKIQPMFKKEQVEGYYFDIINEVGEKFKQRWFALTEHGGTQIDLSKEMVDITMEIILKMLFGKDNLNDETVALLRLHYRLALGYLKKSRILASVDLRKTFHMPSYYAFRRSLTVIEETLAQLSAQYRKDSSAGKDKYNMLAALIEAHKEDPERFTEKDIRDQSISMVFGGFETTSVFMQWLCYSLDSRPDIAEKIRSDIASHAPSAAQKNSMDLTNEQISKMDYLALVVDETMRLYPPIWAISRQPVEDDYLGDYKIERGTTVLVPEISMHRHPNWWDQPNAFIPERFLPENNAKISEGLYFPFAHGPRKCIGYKMAEMEAKILCSKFLPLFNIKVLDRVTNGFDPGISLTPKHPIRVYIERRS